MPRRPCGAWSAASTCTCKSRWCARSGKRASCGRRPPNTRSPRRWATRAIPTKARGSAPRWSGTAISATSPKCTPGPTGRCGRRASPRFPKQDPIPSTLDWDLWLGIAEKRPFTADGKTDPDQNGGFFYQPFNWRGFYDFGCGALGDMACHILGAPNMALHLSQSQDRQRGVHQEGRHEPLHVPQGVGDPLRFRGVRQHAAAEGLLVRRAEGDPQDRRRSGRRMARRSAQSAGAGGRGGRAAGAVRAGGARATGGRAPGDAAHDGPGQRVPVARPGFQLGGVRSAEGRHDAAALPAARWQPVHRRQGHADHRHLWRHDAPDPGREDEGLPHAGRRC